MSRRVIRTCLIALLFVSNVAVSANADVGGFFFGFRLGIKGRPVHTFSNFPLYMRSVPLHPDDGYLAGYPHATEVLPDHELTGKSYDYLDFSTSIMRWSPLYGINFSAGLIMPGNTQTKHYQYEQNQYGTPQRGYGTSLRYYFIESEHPTIWGVGPFICTPWHYLSRTVYIRGVASARYDLSGYPMNMEAGWDRFNVHAPWRYEKLGKIYEDRLTMEVDVGMSHLNQHAEQGRGYAFVQLHVPRFRFQRKASNRVEVRFNHVPYVAVGGGYTY